MADQKAQVTRWGRKLLRLGRRGADELDAAALSLVADAGAAARLREYQRDANVAALGIERTRNTLDGWGWFFIVLGLAFTTVNVQAFVANGALPGSLGWVTAWFVEPLVMGMMLVLLRGEQVANRHGEQSHFWVQFTRWFALGVTYVMNTSAYWLAATGIDWKGAFTHSIPVVLVALAAEALVRQRITLTRVVDKVAETVPVEPPQKPQERLEDEDEGQDTGGHDEDEQDELVPPRNNVDYAYEAFCRLAAAREERGLPIEEIGPAEVDRAAGVPTTTSKRQGRMARYAEDYRKAKEVSDGHEDDGDEDAEAAG